MLLTEARGKEQVKEEVPEQFFAKYILTRAFEDEAAAQGRDVLTVGLVGPNTAYELSLLEPVDTEEDLFMVRVASYPSRGIDDWIRTAIFSARHEAREYIYHLKSNEVSAQRV